MTNDEGMTETQRPRRIVSSFGIRRSTFGEIVAFTILELLVVISIIIVLAGLILATTGYVQNKGARSRAEAEIAAMSAACESYKADNGVYPSDATKTDKVDPSASPIPAAATQYLYEELSGNSSATLQPVTGKKSYFAFKPQMLSGQKDNSGNLTSVSYIADPFGNAYGYSTAKAAGAAFGYNPTFDLWSIANAKPTTDQNQWIKNW